MDVTNAQIIAFRLAAQGLAGPPASDPLQLLEAWTVQDSPPGAATAALVNRLGRGDQAESEPGDHDAVPVGWLDDALASRAVVALYNARTATAVVPAADAAIFATGMLPVEDADFKALVRTSVPEQRSGYAEPVELAVETISEVLDGRALSRDDLHEELRQRLPKALLPWCEPCGSHHAKRGLLVMASLRGRLCISGRAGRQPEFSRTDQWVDWGPPARAEAQRALLEQYLRAYGPSTPSDFAEWAGLSKPHARRIWGAADDAGALTVVTVDGTGAGALLTTDAERLADPPAAEGVVMLGPGDPLLVGRDRERLVPEAAVRKKLWSALPTTGLVLADGQPVATWKANKRGKRLDVTVDRFARGGRRSEIEAAAERLAAHRGVSGVAVTFA